MTGQKYLSLAGLLVFSSALMLSGCKTGPDRQPEKPSAAPTAESSRQPGTSEAAANRNAETNAPVADAPRPARPSESAPMRKDEPMPVAEMQARLRDLGYNPGPVDGKMGKGTIAALKSFQHDNNLAVTGHADAATVDRLRQQKADARAGTAMPTSTPSVAEDVDPSIASCLRAWGTHPFGRSPQYKRLATSVKIFGLGQNPVDAEQTDSPSLVLVNPGVNVMGGKTLELLNPNGWYCFRANVNVMGGVNIKAHCKAHLASASEGVTVLGSNSENKGTTVLGKTRVTLVGCQ
jgi:hypothetical protein